MSASKVRVTSPSEERRNLMQRVRRKDTAPEVVVRKILFSDGYRYRLHRRHLPGTPDIVLAKRKKTIFVNGCFWHSHACKKGTIPKTNRSFWIAKFAANRLRDRRNIANLRKLEYQSLVVWECETADHSRLRVKLRRFLENP